MDKKKLTPFRLDIRTRQALSVAGGGCMAAGLRALVRSYREARETKSEQQFSRIAHAVVGTQFAGNTPEQAARERATLIAAIKKIMEGGTDDR